MARLMSTPPTPHRPDEVRADERSDRPRWRCCRATGAARWTHATRLRGFLAGRVSSDPHRRRAAGAQRADDQRVRHGLGRPSCVPRWTTACCSCRSPTREMSFRRCSPSTRRAVGGLGLRIVDELRGVGRRPVPGRQDGVGNAAAVSLITSGLTPPTSPRTSARRAGRSPRARPGRRPRRRRSDARAPSASMTSSLKRAARRRSPSGRMISRCPPSVWSESQRSVIDR